MNLFFQHCPKCGSDNEHYVDFLATNIASTQGKLLVKCSVCRYQHIEETVDNRPPEVES